LKSSHDVIVLHLCLSDLGFAELAIGSMLRATFRDRGYMSTCPKPVYGFDSTIDKNSGLFEA